MDLTNLSFSELKQLDARVATEISARKQAEINVARQQIKEIAESAGLSLAALLNTPQKPKTARTSSIKFRHPQQPELTWSGQGRAPHWFKEWVNTPGKSRDELMVAP